MKPKKSKTTPRLSLIDSLILAGKERCAALRGAAKSAQEHASKLAVEVEEASTFALLLEQAMQSPWSVADLAPRRAGHPSHFGVYFMADNASGKRAFKEKADGDALTARLKLTHIGVAAQAGLLRENPGFISHAVRVCKSQDEKVLVIQRATIQMDSRVGIVYGNPHGMLIAVRNVSVKF